ncbi:class II aldolase family protein [Deltaproteobacteria bacterium Smac51]|nr:class II aldolase family protein [Deltaproteobacteria bacterium Smac51]
MNEQLNNLKNEVLGTALKMFEEKLCAGTSGNVSAFYPKEKLVVITPSSYDYAIMEAEDIVVIDLEGNRIEGRHKPSSEWKMHAELYKGLERVKAVVHTHSPYATSFAALRKEVPVILIEMAPALNGSLEVSPYAAQGTAEVGTYALPILEKKNACLLANHGVVAVGEDLRSAYLSAAYAEDAARICHLAMCIGQPVVLE